MTVTPAPSEVAPIDLAFARFMARGTADTVAALLHHSALLVSAERALGNSCVDLQAFAEQPSPVASDGFVFPPVAEWQATLLDTGRCTLAAHDDADAVSQAPLVLDGARLYLRRYYSAERRLAAAISARVSVTSTDSLESSTPLFRRLFPAAATTLDWQAVAAVAALRSSLVFVTGGPGTGKTTVAARLLALLLDRDPTLGVAVAAPTGRAAARLTEAIGGAVQREQLQALVGAQLPSEGSTLHRLLGYTPWNERFRHHAGNPLPQDVVIVDEASMVDVLMMDALFAALRPTARLIVLGDPDQLASVDTGFVLGDVARAARLAATPHADQHSAQLARDYAQVAGGDAQWLDPQPSAGALRDAVVRLRVSYRFGARPGIGRLAAAVQEGDVGATLEALNGTPDEVSLDAWPTALDSRASVAAIESLLGPLRSHVEEYLSADTPSTALSMLARFRLLCAMREGDTGVTGLNALVEQWLGARARRVEGWYDHRPVLITANDPGVRLFNGDVGVTLAVDGVPLVHFPTADGGVRSLPPVRLPAHETAWAMTIHKSQGSEFDHVRVVLPTVDNRLLTRELLYTGITRAKHSVSLVGHTDIVRLAVQRSVARASGLVSLLAP